MMKYKVLWFDDEYRELESSIAEPAWLNQIELIGYDNAEDGLNWLNKHMHQVDAVVVDALFYEKSGSKGDVSDPGALGAVMMRLKEVERIKSLPVFILSGKPGYTKDGNEALKALKITRVYDKLKSADLDQLWDDIKSAAHDQPDTQIRHKYANLFDLCNEDYLGEQNKVSLLEAIKDADSDHLPDQVSAMERIRDFIERMFGALNKKQLIPDGILKEPGWINKSSSFLAGKHEQYKWVENPIHPAVSFMLKGVLDMCQDVKHDLPEKLSLKVKDFMHQNQSPYLYKALLFQTFEILLWFHRFMQENPDPEVNMSLWTFIAGSIDDAIEGVVEKDEKGNYHCCGILLGYNRAQAIQATEGCRVRILKKVENTKPETKERYPFFSREFEKL